MKKLGETLDKVVDSAKRDREVAKMLREIAELDAKLMPGGAVFRVGHTMERGYLKQAERLSDLCDKIARKIVGADQDAEEMAMWISYNCQQVVRELDRK